MKEFSSEKSIQGREICAYGGGEFWLPVFSLADCVMSAWKHWMMSWNNCIWEMIHCTAMPFWEVNFSARYLFIFFISKARWLNQITSVALSGSAILDSQ